MYDQNTILRTGGTADSVWNVKTTESEGVWVLGWGGVDEDGVTAVQLRAVAPTQKPDEEEASG
jgi:hypothetical protein